MVKYRLATVFVFSLLASILMPVGALNAQNTSYTDSLELVLQGLPNDSSKVLVLNELAYTYAETDLAKARDRGLASVLLANKIGFVRGRSSAQCALGNIAADGNDQEGALRYYKAALADKLQLGDAKGAATINNNIGIIYKNLGLFKEALQYYQGALSKRLELGDLRGQADSYNNIGNVYRGRGAADSCMDFFRKSLAIRIQIKDENGIAGSYYNIGGVLNDQGKFKESLIYHLKAAEIFEKRNDLRSLVLVYVGIAKLNKRLSNPEGGIRYGLLAKDIAEKGQMKVWFADIYEFLGEAYQDERTLQGDKEAKRYFLLALKFAQEAKGIQESVGIYGGLAIAAQREGMRKKAYGYYRQALSAARSIDSKQDIVMTLNAFAGTKLHFKDTVALLPILREAEALAKAGKFTPRVQTAYKNYADYYLLTRDTLRARQSSDTSSEVGAAIFTKEVAKTFASEQTRYETLKKDAEIHALKDKQEIDALKLSEQKLLVQERNYQVAALISLALILSVAAYLIYQRQKTRLRVKAEREMLEAENRERVRIARDMHDDLGSGLSRISLMAGLARRHTSGNAPLDKEMAEISGLSSELVDNMRDLIWVLDPENTSLEYLVAHIREYCSEAMERAGRQVHLHFPHDIPDIQISRDGQRNIFLTVKEAVHNCVKHAGDCSITFTLTFDNETFMLELKDNGKGYNHASLKTSGNGLRNMKARIEAIGGIFHVYSEIGSGTSTAINIPMAAITAKKLMA